jgi:hypothetical protein
MRGAAFNSNTYDIRESIITAYNINFTSTPENTGYINLAREIYSESINHDQIAGAYRAWTKGGVTSSQAVTVPTGFTQAMETVLENASVEGYWQKEITVGAGASVNITSYLRKATSMLYLPRVIVFNKASTDPFAGGAGLHTFTMTDSIDTWEDDLYTYTNSGTEDVTLVIRCQGMNATGNMYSALEVEQINVDLTGAIALINGVKAKTDQLVFTVANQVDANALTGGGGATAADVRIEMDANSTKLAAILADTNELQADWVNGGRLDLILDAAGSAGDPWTTALPGAYGAGTAGKIIGDNINAPIATVDTVVDAIKTVVDDIHDTDLPAVKSDTAAILEDTGTTLDTLIKDIPTNAELATALGTADDATLAAIAGLDTKIDTIDNFLDTEIAAILEDTGTTLPATLTTIEGKVDAVDNYVDTEVAAIKSVVDDILVDTGTTLDALVKDIPTTAELTALVVGADADTLETLSDQLDLLTTIPGSLAWDYTITDGSSVPIPDVLVWITSDIGGSSVIARGITNASGVASFMLDPGTVYVWCYKYGWSFSNPDTEVVS